MSVRPTDQAMAPVSLPPGVGALLDASPEAFVAVDLHGNVVAWNGAATAILGWGAGEVLGRPLPKVRDRQQARLFTALTESGSEAVLGAQRRRDGRVVTIHADPPVPLTGPDGGVVATGRFFRLTDQPLSQLARRNLLAQELVEVVRLPELRETLVRALQELLGTTRAVVLRPDHDAGVLRGHLAIGLPQETADLLTVPLDDPTLGRVVSCGRRAATGELSFGDDRPQPALFVPMGPAQSGWVLALGFPGGVPASSGVEALARAVAWEAWEALRRVELIAELEAKIEILEATAAVSASAGLDLDELVRAVCVCAADALSCERVGVYLWEEEELTLAYLEVRDREFFSPDCPEASDGSRTAAALLARGEPVVIQDAAGEPVLAGPWSPEFGAVAVLSRPLRVRDRDLGVLVVAHTAAHPRGFTNLCRLVAEAIAQQASLAIENARLFAAERAAVQRLAELDQLKADFVAGITHDLRTPLTGLLGFVRTLRRMGDVVSNEERREFLEIMERQATRLTGMVEDLITGARLDAGQLEPDDAEPLALDELVGEALGVLDSDRRARVTVQAREDVVVHGDRLQLVRVVQNLLDNALKYSTDPAPVVMTVGRAGDQAVLAVRDHGPGIPDEQQATLFTRFGRGERSRRSTGLGLFVCRGIVSAHGGELRLADTGPRGTTFEVRLPLALS